MDTFKILGIKHPLDEVKNKWIIKGGRRWEMQRDRLKEILFNHGANIAAPAMLNLDEITENVLRERGYKIA